MSYRFLIVDDTQFMRKLAADSLRQFDYEVAGEAENGKEAIKRYQELQPDVVMMDLTMPEMNGIEAIKEILNIDPSAVILVCSASNQQDMIQDALTAGAKGYLTKPFKPDIMKDIILKYALPHLAPSAEAESEIAAALEECEMEEEEEQEEVREAKEAPQSIELPSIQAPLLREEPTDSSTAGTKLKRFVTRYMCSWEEEQDGAPSQYSVICTDQAQDICIEWTDGEKEKQRILLSMDGFRHLTHWLEQQQPFRKVT